MEKLFFYDLETTGVMHWKNGIHQIAGKIVIDGEIKEVFNFKVAPNPLAIISAEALKVGGVTLEQIQAYPSMKEVYLKLIKMMSKYVDRYSKFDKFHLVGYNNRGFDDNFFRAFFVQNLDDYFGSWFWSDSIDVLVLASQKLKDVRSKMENFKQMTVARQFGMEVDDSKLHDAQYDIELCMFIYKKCIK